MDLSRPIVAAEGEPPLDHLLLVATAAVRQAGTRTARLAARSNAADAAPHRAHALIAVFVGADPAAGARALGGSFHSRVARRTAASTSMKPLFTLAF